MVSTMDRASRFRYYTFILFLVSTSSPKCCMGIDPTEMHRDICTLDAHCLNGGKCLKADNATIYRQCQCKEGFSGPRCSEYCPFECQNGGYCTIALPKGADENSLVISGLREQTPTYDPNDYMCKCFGRYTGKLCEIPYVNCGSKGRCYNGGVCVIDTDQNQGCFCPAGFTGSSCELLGDYTDQEEGVQTLPGDEEDLSKNIQEGGKQVVSVLMVLIILLGASLIIVLSRNQYGGPPKFVNISMTERDDEDEESINETDASESGVMKV